MEKTLVHCSWYKVAQALWKTVWRFLKSRTTISSVAQLCPTLCDPMNRSTPGLPVHHQLPEFTQTQVQLIHFLKIYTKGNYGKEVKFFRVIFISMLTHHFLKLRGNDYSKIRFVLHHDSGVVCRCVEV